MSTGQDEERAASRAARRSGESTLLLVVAVVVLAGGVVGIASGQPASAGLLALGVLALVLARRIRGAAGAARGGEGSVGATDDVHDDAGS